MPCPARGPDLPMTPDRRVERRLKSRPRRHVATGTRSAASIDDVQCVAQRTIEFRALDLIEHSDGQSVEIFDGNRDDVVATDDAFLRESLGWADGDFRPDSSDGPGDRRTCHGGEHSGSCIPSQHAHRPSPGRRSEVSPIDLVAAYHPGAVRAANDAADRTSSASGGRERYAACSSMSAAAASSAAITARAPRRNSSDRFVCNVRASSSSWSTSSSSNCTSTSRRAMSIC